MMNNPIAPQILFPNIQEPTNTISQNEDGGKKKSFIVLIISSLIPSGLWAFLILSYIFSLKNLGLEGFAFFIIGFIMTPVLIGTNIGIYLLGIKLLKLPKLGARAFLVPIIIGIISANCFLVTYQLFTYIVVAKYASLNPMGSIVEEKIIPASTTGDVSVSFNNYEYKINLSNNTNTTFDRVPIFVSLVYTDKKSGKNVHLGGSDPTSLDIKPGNNYLQGKALVDTNSIIEGKLKVLISLPVAPPREVIIDTNPQIDKDLQHAITDVKEQRENIASLTNFSLPTTNPEIIQSNAAPANWKKFSDDELSFSYPLEWVEDKHSLNDNVLLKQVWFNTVDQVLIQSKIAFIYQKYRNPALEVVKGTKKDNKDLEISAIQIDGKLGTKLVNPRKYTKEEDPYQSRKEITVIFPVDDTTVWTLAGDKKDIYDVLSTLRFSK